MDFGVKIEVDRNDLAAINALVTGLSDFDAAPLVEEIVQLGENQTRKRIESGGPGPDGQAWPANQTGTPILFRTGRHLHDSIASSSSGTSGEWGAAWEFAHAHQYGATITPKSAGRLVFMLGDKRVFAKKVMIPARPFVGVSAEDAEEIKALVTDYLGRLLP
jgi:phage virion morphogenesis protein